MLGLALHWMAYIRFRTKISATLLGMWSCSTTSFLWLVTKNFFMMFALIIPRKEREIDMNMDVYMALLENDQPLTNCNKILKRKLSRYMHAFVTCE